jgi:glucose/arabinose dehydrogenase
MSIKNITFVLAALPLIIACNSNSNEEAGQADTVNAKAGQEVQLPAPDESASKNKFSKVIGWPEGKAPVAPAGFTVTKFATDIKSPRNIYIAPNGDILAVLSNTERDAKDQVANAISGKAKSEQGGKSANTIVLFRDANNDGKPELQSEFLTGLNQPYGALIIGDTFYVANTDGIMAYPYKTGDTKISGAGKKILSLPAGGYNNHWTRNIIANADNSKIYVSVGSGSNVGENGMEHEVRRAAVLEINPDGSGEIIYASGLRNPTGLALEPGTNVLWTAVNERDGLGDDLVPDYVTSVKKGGFYGWPYAYFGQHEDPRMKGQKPDLVKKTIVPDIAVGAHTASLGLAFYKGKTFPGKYQGGMFVGQHGSWNRSVLSGYKVTFIPHKDGKKAGQMEDFLTGFIADKEKGEVYGRPVGVAISDKNAMFVADDVSNTIWRVSAK